ncbi:phage tail protein [Anaeromusa acidaminophila]|uniref:phage tail protein n=1 Tax=Anaeromusa acidaminophila TaxID=81464 RepID=UPI001C00DB13
MIWFAAPTPPEGFIECNGQSTAAYPALAAVVGAFVPDLRGEFIRGWVHDRAGIVGESGTRVFGTYQADALQNITGSFGNVTGGATYTSGAFALNGPPLNQINAGVSATHNSWTFDASRVVRTADETRPTNVALLPCIKY